MNKLLLFIVCVSASLFLVASVHQAYSGDWKGKPQWSGTAHDDNKPNDNLNQHCSENLKKCAKSIDDMKYRDGDVSFEQFKKTNAWKTADEEQKVCILESADLGDNLATYEIQKCYQNYDYYEER